MFSFYSRYYPECVKTSDETHVFDFTPQAMRKKATRGGQCPAGLPQQQILAITYKVFRWAVLIGLFYKKKKKHKIYNIEDKKEKQCVYKQR